MKYRHLITATARSVATPRTPRSPASRRRTPNFGHRTTGGISCGTATSGRDRPPAGAHGSGGCWASPTIRSMSAAGERAVSQRSDYRCQQPGVFERQVIIVKVHQGVAYDDRAAVSGAEQLGDVGVLSAAGFGGGGLIRDAGFVHRHGPGPRAGRCVIEVAG